MLQYKFHCQDEAKNLLFQASQLERPSLAHKWKKMYMPEACWMAKKQLWLAWLFKLILKLF